MVDPVFPIYDASKDCGTWQRKMAKVSIIAAVLSALWVIYALTTSYEHAQSSILGLAAVWAVAPPTWFFYEYFFVYPKASYPGTWESFKYGQQVAVAVWAGVTATLYGLGSSDLAKPEKMKVECSIVIPAPVPATSTTSNMKVEIVCPTK